MTTNYLLKYNNLGAKTLSCIYGDVCGMIKEGQNLANIDAGIVIQLGGKERDFVQQFGRAMRASTPVQHLLVMNAPKDFKYLNTALEHKNPKYLRNVYTQNQSRSTDRSAQAISGGHYGENRD